MAEQAVAAPMMARFAKTVSELGNPTRGTQGYGYKYADLAEVESIIKPVLKENGLAYYHSRTVVGEDTEYEELHIVDIETGEKHLMDMRLCVKSSDPQVKGSDETYSRRYSLMAVFGLSPVDDDGRAAKPKEAEGNGAGRVLNGACKSYAERHGMTLKDVQDWVLARDDYDGTSECKYLIAEELMSS